MLYSKPPDEGGASHRVHMPSDKPCQLHHNLQSVNILTRKDTCASGIHLCLFTWGTNGNAVI